MKACFIKSFPVTFWLKFLLTDDQNRLLFEEGFLSFPWSTEEKSVVVAGEQMAAVACFWDLYLVAELCRRLVTFAATYNPCHKGSVAVLCLSFNIQHFPSCVAMELQGNTTCFPAAGEVLQARMVCMQPKSWVLLWDLECHARLQPDAAHSFVSAIDLAGFRLGWVLSKFTFKQVWQVWLLIPVAKSSAFQAPTK